MDALVSTGWLEDQLGAPDLRILDSTLHLPGSGRDARAQYEAEHIPGALFFDIDELSDRGSPFPHMLPPEHQFASGMGALGISDRDRIVVYDSSALRSAARAWWMLRIHGAKNVGIVDGGLAKWKAEGRPLESGSPTPRPASFTASFEPAAVASKQLVHGIAGRRECQLVDARGPGRFRGEEPEPRRGLAAGHIPGSINLPYAWLLNADGTWKQGDVLRAAFEEAGVDLEQPMVTTCGSGVTAAVLLFGAHLLGKHDVKLYDGSWAEWGADPTTPKATGRP